MSKKHITDEVEGRSSKDIRIGPELADILVWLCDNGYTVTNGDTEKTATITNNCSEATYNRLERLTNLDLVNKVDKGPATYIIHERTGEVLNGKTLQPYIDQEIRRLSGHVRADPLIEWVVAIELDTTTVVNELQSGTVDERRDKLEEAVRAIEDHPAVSKGPYGAVVFRNSSNEYQATKKVERLKSK